MMNFITKYAGVIASVAIVIAIVAYANGSHFSAFGTASTPGNSNVPVVLQGGSQPTAFNALYVGESFYTDGPLYASSTAMFTGASTFFGATKFGTSNGTALNNLQFGTCTIYAYATTIAATTTANVDCQAGSSTLTALAGVQSGDTVMVNATSSISTVNQGVAILSAHASTTNGYITLQLLNLTGTTFTWTATASTTIKYMSLR